MMDSAASTSTPPAIKASIMKKIFNASIGCSMNRCFNWTKCLETDDLKVYVYPVKSGSVISPIYEKILRVIRESALYTEDPERACLFVLSIDTIDRDTLSNNIVKNVDQQIKALPPNVWSNGTNHLIFNLYFGTYPYYSYVLNFNSGNAMIAWASANVQNFRSHFDVSFPLFHNEHPLRSIPKKPRLIDLKRDRYIASFKGKRYVFGRGMDTRTRNALFRLHDNTTLIFLTTCKHTVNWEPFKDDRCAIDNVAYEKWDYAHLLNSSTFCLTPRGRRLGSFRFLEVLRAGCIPMVLSDDWLLPLFDVIDWSKATLIWPEDIVLFSSDYLAEISQQKITEMKEESILLYHYHFNSIEKIVLTSIESVFERVRVAQGKYSSLSMLKNRQIVENLAMHMEIGGFTAVVQAILRDSFRLNRVIAELSRVKGTKKIIILWPLERGVPPPQFTNLSERNDNHIELQFKEVSAVDQSEYLMVDPKWIVGDYALFVDERIRLSDVDLNAAFQIVMENPTRLVTFYAAHHVRNESTWTLCATKNTYSFSWLHLAFLHKTFLMKFHMDHLPRRPVANSWYNEQCYVSLLNFMMADLSLNSPLFFGTKNKKTRMQESWMSTRNESICFNKLINDFYDGEVPLISSDLGYVLPY